MKKLLAILLAATFVLGLSGIANAAFTATGTVEIKFAVAGAFDFLGVTKAETKLKLSNAWGNASGDITYILKTGADYADLTDVNVDTANFKYAFSDVFSIGATYKYKQFKVYSSDVFFNEYSTPVDEEALMMATYAFDGGSFKFYTEDLDNFYGVLAYDGDPIDVGVWLLDIGGAIQAVAEVEYTFINDIELECGIDYGPANLDFGVQVGYESDTMELEGGIIYDINGGLLIGMYAEASVGVAENLNLIAEYEDDAGTVEYAAGVEYVFSGDTLIEVVYNEAGEIAGKLVLKF